jgi:hypothetical protein
MGTLPNKGAKDAAIGVFTGDSVRSKVQAVVEDWSLLASRNSFPRSQRNNRFPEGPTSPDLDKLPPLVHRLVFWAEPVILVIRMFRDGDFDPSMAL